MGHCPAIHRSSNVAKYFFKSNPTELQTVSHNKIVFEVMSVQVEKCSAL